MKILAVIPARGGSKRLPGKNIRPLGGLPLIAWSIRSALESGACADVLVSTDDPGIAEIARAHGATVPGLRPAALATDTATSADVCLHALETYGKPVDGLLLLQPTSPFRDSGMIRRGVELFRANGLQPVVSVSPTASHPFWCYRIDNNGRLEPFIDSGPARRSQDLPPAYALNGALYLIAPADLRAHRTLVPAHTRPLLCDNPEAAIDIDTESDWKMAEAWLTVSA